MKQYLLFTYYVGRPLGGVKDFLDSFDTIEEALDNILEEWTRYYQVVDRDTMEVVKEGLARFKHFSPNEFKKGRAPHQAVGESPAEKPAPVNEPWHSGWKRPSPPSVEGQ